MVVKKEMKKRKITKIDTRTKGEKIADANRERAKRPTIKQKKFAAEYIRTGNATQSAKNAGYSEKTAYSIGNENLNKPEIKKEIQSAAEKLHISSEYVLKGIKEIAEFNKQKQTKFITVGDNTFEENKMIDPQASLKAHDLLGKHLKLFTDQIEIKAEVKTEDQELTDAVRQLLFLATQS